MNRNAFRSMRAIVLSTLRGKAFLPTLVLLILGAVAPSSPAAEKPKRPNIVIILADDKY